MARPPEAVELVQYSFRMKSNKPRFLTIDACIITFEPQRRMTFRFGFGGLLSFEESYAVEPVPFGSRLVPCFRCTGLLSALNLWKMTRNFSEMLEIIEIRRAHV